MAISSTFTNTPGSEKERHVGEGEAGKEERQGRPMCVVEYGDLLLPKVQL